MTQPVRRITPSAEAAAADQKRIARIRMLAALLDGAVRVPGTTFRIGLDPIIGLIPGIGDVLTTGASLYIVYQGHKLGASGATIRKMLLNVGIDFLIGEVPVVGDFLDFGMKANKRNLRLLGLDDGTQIDIDLLGWLGGQPPDQRGPNTASQP